MKKLLCLIILISFSSSSAIAKNHEIKFITKKKFIDDNIKRLNERFDQIDTNKDGKMTRDEETIFMKKIQNARANKRFLFKTMDTNKDGKISPNEEKKLLMAMDSNKDGEVSPQEQKNYFKKLSKKK